MPPGARTQHDDDEAIGSAARNKKRQAALSCAECRRLKLRCDRKFPCSACIKRGCGAICPDGSLTTGKGNRFVLANTEILHEKILELSNRVRELEDALANSHAALSRDRHPMLRDELLRIKNPLERESFHEMEKETEEDDVVDAVGSLSISHTGRASFYGQTANSWYLLQNEEGESSEELGAPDLILPSDIPWLNHAFPFTSSVGQTAQSVRGTLMGLLPDVSTAQELAHYYYEHAAWMYDPLPRRQFDEFFARIYDSEAGAEPDPSDAHRLAVLFTVFALGTLLDLRLPSRSAQAAQYYRLGRASLALDSVFDEPSVPAIQALLLMCHYLFLADIDGPRWTIMGIVVKLAQSIGLHRDSTRWNLDAEETQKRRELMWEIYVYDSWQSLTFGRPPSFSMAHIDSKMAHETVTNSAGQVEMSFAAWKHRFSSECLSVVHDRAFGARAPSYVTIMELDRKVRNYYVPPSLQVPGFGGAGVYQGIEQPPLRVTMQRHIILAIKEVTTLYMHRGFFARAMDDHPDDPLGSKYGQSVLSAHRSASSFIALVQSLWSQHRALTERMWFLFTHVFSCAIVLGSIPARCPGMGLARSALQSLDQAYDLFTKVSELSRAAKVLPVLKKLRERAHASMADLQRRQEGGEPGLNTGAGVGVGALRGTQDPDVKRDDEEFATLGGRTRFVALRPPQQSSQSPASSGGTRSASSSPVVPVYSYGTPPRVPVFAEQSQPLMADIDPHAHPYSHAQSHTRAQTQPYPHPQPQSHDPHAQAQAHDMALYAQSPSQSPHHSHRHHSLPQPLPQSLPQPHSQSHWQQQSQQQFTYAHMPMQDVSVMDTMDISAQDSYSGYEYAAPQRSSYLSISPQPLLSRPGGDTMSPPTVDIDASWRNYFAQFNTA